jgi:uncharacterized metal-binding protein
MGVQRNLLYEYCYNFFVTDDMKAYRARWQAVSEIERQENQAASIDLRWQQLNALIGLAIGLDILKADKSEDEVYQRWAKLKSRAARQHPKF